MSAGHDSEAVPPLRYLDDERKVSDRRDALGGAPQAAAGGELPVNPGLVWSNGVGGTGEGRQP
jgi:hypothetical protein